MADDATVTISATILPDEIAKTIAGSMTVAPDDANAITLFRMLLHFQHKLNFHLRQVSFCLYRL